MRNSLLGEENFCIVHLSHFNPSHMPSNSSNGIIPNTRTLLEQADRARRAAEQELNDANETMSDLKVQNQSIAANKRRMEAELDNLKVQWSRLMLLPCFLFFPD